MTTTTIMYLLGNRGDRIPYKVDDTETIAKNDVCELNADFEVIAQTNADTPVVGIAAHEKVANDGMTEMAVITNCVAKMTVVSGGSATKGDTVSMDATNNEINLATSLDDEKGWSIGWAMDDGAAGDTIPVRINK